MKKLFYIMFENGYLFLLSCTLILCKVLRITKHSWKMTLLGVFCMYATYIITYIIFAVTDKDYKGFHK